MSKKESFETRINRLIEKNKCPIVFDWVEVDSEVGFGQINYEKSYKTGKLLIDISYCATRAINQNIERTILYNPDRIKLTDKRN